MLWLWCGFDIAMNWYGVAWLCCGIVLRWLRLWHDMVWYGFGYGMVMARLRYGYGMVWCGVVML